MCTYTDLSVAFAAIGGVVGILIIFIVLIVCVVCCCCCVCFGSQYCSKMAYIWETRGTDYV